MYKQIIYLHSDKKKWNTMDIPDLLNFFYIFLIDLARLYPVEWSSVSLVAKMLLNIVLHSLRKCQQIAVAYSVLFVEILYMSHTFNRAALSGEQIVSSWSMLHWFDKAFPVQTHESGIPSFIQLYFCQSEDDVCLSLRFHSGTKIRIGSGNIG